MIRGYNIGTECYALLTSSTKPDFLLPIKIIILEKYSLGNNTTYKVKIRDIFETDFQYLKDNFIQVRVQKNIKGDLGTLIKKTPLNNINNKTELLTYLNDQPFFLEDKYITLDKEGLKDLYNKFVRYLINYHYRQLFRLMSRSFLANTPIFENQKEMFLKRVNKIGFKDIFDKFEFDLEV